jgi:hypothetical protein
MHLMDSKRQVVFFATKLNEKFGMWSIDPNIPSLGTSDAASIQILHAISSAWKHTITDAHNQSPALFAAGGRLEKVA